VSRIVVAEKISASGIDLLRADGHEIVDAVGWPREKLLTVLADADALLVRSGTKVDAPLLAAAPKLTVVGRAGVGVDNVEMAEATRRGVLAINSPTGNVVSAVEHTFAMLLALLRRIVPAAASLRSGKWERSAFVGSELEGKTIGIVGLGQVGSRVASRAAAFGATVVGFDPFLPVIAGEWRRAAGRLGGAALDVFDPEPPDVAHPIFSRANVLATPHLGASTQEAQERVAAQTVEAVREALSGAAYVAAVNLPFRRLADASGAAAWMDLAERGAKFLRGVADGLVSAVAVDAWNLPGEFLRPSALAAVKGVLSGTSPETVNLVNALSAARDRGIAISETSHEDRGGGGYACLLRVTATGRAARSTERSSDAAMRRSSTAA
jgi:phosphoglycerate dehydrogenase-like enzyme